MEIRVPASIEEATERLEGIESLLTAKGWERAAIVYAFTTNQQGSNQHSRKVVNALGVKEFADLGIAGLSTQDTVRLYRERWAEYGDPGIKPGDVVTLPDLDWPPTRTGTDGHESEEGMERTVGRMIDKHGAEKVARATAKRDPEAVGRVAGETPAALRAAVESSTPRDGREGERQARTARHAEDLDVTFLPEVYVRKGLREIAALFGAWHARQPEQADAFLHFVEEMAAEMRLSKEGSVSDEEIAAFMEAATEGGAH